MRIGAKKYHETYFMTASSDLINIAVDHHRSGRLHDAEQIYRQILASEPHRSDAWYLFGVLAFQVGQYAIAAANIGQALALNPNWPEAHFSLGAALQEQGNFGAAIASYRRAIELNPNYADALNNLGNVFIKQGNTDEALACFRRALSINPSLVQACSAVGAILQDRGQTDDAVSFLRQAVELDPNFASAHSNLGNALRDQGRLDEAIFHFQKALELNPTFADAHNNLGTAFMDRGMLDDAAACYRRAIELNAEYASAYSHLANVLKDQGQCEEAVTCFRKAIALNPALTLALSNLLYTLYFCPGYDSAAIYQEHQQWNTQHAAMLSASIKPHPNDPNPTRRLRVGYFSPYFRLHAEAFFLLPLLASHDHKEFEIVCYSDLKKPDDLTRVMRSHADLWKDIRGLTDDQVARLIRQDEIDILVDLALHMDGRPLLFARKPAPLQVCWLAYPGTTGILAMDYRLTDPYLDPPGLYDQYYSERSIRLPDCFWCYDPLTAEPQVNSLPAAQSKRITFGSFNNFCKTNTEVLTLWAHVMKAVDSSRLILLSHEGSHREHALTLLQREGIDRKRVTFVSQRPRPQYLELYHQIDIGLDTFPANGHTTTLDSLWMGVPVVTLVGNTAIGRGALCQLTNVGLQDLIADSPSQYIRIAANLAKDIGRLTDLRASLRQKLEASPLMDAPRFTRNFEAALRHMWRQWCSKRGPV
jgi:protein O-GlcNAc transferase